MSNFKPYYFWGSLHTDTTSLFALYENEKEPVLEFMNNEIKNFVRMQIKDDTAVFTKNFYLNDSVISGHITSWRIIEDISSLSSANKILIFDSDGNRVSKIKIVKRKELTWAGKIYINEETNRELFHNVEIIYCISELDEY